MQDSSAQTEGASIEALETKLSEVQAEFAAFRAPVEKEKEVRPEPEPEPCLRNLFTGMERIDGRSGRIAQGEAGEGEARVGETGERSIARKSSVCDE